VPNLDVVCWTESLDPTKPCQTLSGLRRVWRPTNARFLDRSKSRFSVADNVGSTLTIAGSARSIAGSTGAARPRTGSAVAGDAGSRATGAARVGTEAIASTQARTIRYPPTVDSAGPAPGRAGTRRLVARGDYFLGVPLNPSNPRCLPTHRTRCCYEGTPRNKTLVT
jgi:hypothetical protein